MEKIKSFLKEKCYPFTIRNNVIVLRYKTESIYGSKGWLHVKFSDGKFLVEEIAPSCKHWIVCSCGQQYVSTSGFVKGNSSVINEDIAVMKLSRILQGYEIVE